MKKEEMDKIKKDLGLLREVFNKYRTLCENAAAENTRLKREIEIMKKSAKEKKP